MKCIMMIFLLISMNCFSSEESHSSYFSSKIDYSDFFERFYIDQNRKSIFIYYRNSPSASLNTLSDDYFGKLGINIDSLKLSMLSEISTKDRLHEYAKLTASTIIYRKYGLRFCAINDREGFLSRYIEGKSWNKIEKFLAVHELEHCYITTMIEPIFPRDEFFGMLSVEDEIGKEKIYQKYMFFLQEVFADLSAISQLYRESGTLEFLDTAIMFRNHLYEKGDLEHYSSEFLIDFYSDSENVNASRDEIIQYLYMKSLDIMAPSLFISLLNK